MGISPHRINVLFLMNEKFTNNFEPVYRAMRQDKRFFVRLCACESRATEYKDRTSSKEIADYFNSKGLECVDTFDEARNEYQDLSCYNPDYIFVSTPYDIYRPESYSSSTLRMLAKVCDIEYGAGIMKNLFDYLDMGNNAFYRGCYAHFIGSDAAHYYADDDRARDLELKSIPIGLVKTETFLGKIPSDLYWHKLFPHTDALRIVWKPRWTLEFRETLFEWLEGFEQLARGNYQVLLLEHPLLRSSLKSAGFLGRYLDMLQRAGAGMQVLESDDFLDYVMASDLLVSSISSIVPEYSITGNPIFITDYHFEDLNVIGQAIVDREHCVKSFNDFREKIINLRHVTRRAVCQDRSMMSVNNIEQVMPSQRLLNWILEDHESKPKSAYYKRLLQELNEELRGIHAILKQGYWKPELIRRYMGETMEIDAMLKYWSDEAKRLSIELEKAEHYIGLVSERDEELRAIHVILEQGYWVPELIHGSTRETAEINTMLKYWSDEAVRLHSELEEEIQSKESIVASLHMRNGKRRVKGRRGWDPYRSRL